MNSVLLYIMMPYAEKLNTRCTTIVGVGRGVGCTLGNITVKRLHTYMLKCGDYSVVSQ